MKFISCDYNENSHYTIVCMEHLNIRFYGIAKLHPEDEYSKYVGAEVAESRATIKALQYEVQLKKVKLHEIENFIRACQQYKNFDKNSSTAKVVFKQYNRKLKEIKNLKDEIESTKESLSWYLKSRDKLMEKIRTKSVNEK